MNASPTRALREEHGLLLEVLECFEQDLAQPAARRLAAFVAIFRGYADFCHHRKEELGLFPLLEGHGLGPAIACMLDEHRAARGLIAELESAADAGDAAGISAAGFGYIDLLRAHIEKENCMLFAVADACLTPAEGTALARRYAEIEADPDFAEIFGRCRSLIDGFLGATHRP